MYIFYLVDLKYVCIKLRNKVLFVCWYYFLDILRSLYLVISEKKNCENFVWKGLLVWFKLFFTYNLFYILSSKQQH